MAKDSLGTVELGSLDAGGYEITCGMGSKAGVLIVK